MGTLPTRMAAVAAALALVALAGCSDDSSDDTEALCAAKTKFAASVDSLRDVDVVQDGTDAARAAFDQVRTDGEAFADAAKSEYEGPVDDLLAALDQLRDAVRDVADDGLQPVVDGSTAVKTSAAALIEKVDDGSC